MPTLFWHTFSQGLQGFLPLAAALAWFDHRGDLRRAAAMRLAIVLSVPATIAATWWFQASSRRALDEALLASIALAIAIIVATPLLKAGPFWQSAVVAAFVGGGIAGFGLLPAAWAALRPGGRLVANIVSIEGERVVLDWRLRNGGELTRIAVSRAESLGAHHAWRPLLPVTQLFAAKSV